MSETPFHVCECVNIIFANEDLEDAMELSARDNQLDLSDYDVRRNLIARLESKTKEGTYIGENFRYAMDSVRGLIKHAKDTDTLTRDRLNLIHKKIYKAREFLMMTQVRILK